MKDNLLKEAIADAKQVRQLAAEAAKMTLEEAFRPQLASMLSSHLRNESRLNEDNDASSEIGSGPVSVKNPGPKSPSKATSASSHIENPGLEVDNVFDGTSAMSGKSVNEAEFPVPGEEEGDVDVDITSPSGAGIGISAPQGALDLGSGPSDMGGGEFGGVGGLEGGVGGDEFGEGSDELDLEAIIRELELDSQGGLGTEEPEFGEPDPMQAPQGGPQGVPPKPQFESFQDPQAGIKVTGTHDGSGRVNETLSGSGDEGVFKDGKKLANVDGVPGGKKVTAGQEVTGTKADRMSESETFDLDEILKEIQMEEAHDSETEKLTVENTELKRSLKEHRDVVLYLKKQLSEVNVLNAQLLFTNKLFRSFDLRLEQKKSIVEAFDRAKSVREVKIIYTTLAESFKGKTAKKSAKSITEGFASKAMGGTSSRKPQDATVLEEGNTQVARMQKLAGIIKS